MTRTVEAPGGWPEQLAARFAVVRAMDEAHPDAAPREVIHAVALGVYNTIEAHRWIGAQLARPPWQSTMLQIFELIGRSVSPSGKEPP
jgi:hypothetical protein